MEELEETQLGLDQVEQVVMEDLEEEGLVMILRQTLMDMLVEEVGTQVVVEEIGMEANLEMEVVEDLIITDLTNQV